MMKKIIKVITLVMLILTVSQQTIAQQAGMTVVGLSGQNMTVAGSILYVPDGGYFNNTGNNYVGVDRIVAGSAGSTITGTAGSRIHLLSANQIDPAAPVSSTRIDVNGLTLNVDITSYNPQNLSLSDIAFGTVAANAAADLSVGRQFAFAATNPFNGTAITDNHVFSNGNRFIIGTSGTLTGYDQNRYVVTNNNAGELRKLGLNNGQSFFYPIGRDENDYTPANMLVSSGGPVDYYVNVRNFAESVPNENIGGYAAMPNVSRTWQVYAGSAGSTAAMDFIHPGTAMYEVNGYNRNNSNVIRFNANSWIPNLPSDAENQSLFGTPVNYWAQQISFMIPATPGDNAYYGKSNAMTVIPVKLGSFTAEAAGCDAKISFTTLSEVNVASIRVERNYTGLQGFWETVQNFASTGNSNVPKQYAAFDTKPSAAVAYYRLAVTDLDGRITYGPVQSVRFNCGGGLVIYPNPVRDFVNVVVPVNSGAYRIRLVNAAGQTVLQSANSASGTVRLNTSALAPGTYFIIYNGQDDKNISVPIIKQ